MKTTNPICGHLTVAWWLKHITALASVSVWLAAPQIFAANWAWSTAPGSANFSANNWTSGTTPGTGTGTPANGDSLYFGTSTSLTLNNDDSSFTFGGLTFNSGGNAFTFNGNSFTLGTSTPATVIAVNNATASTINNAITLGNAQQTISLVGASLTLGGAISGSGSSLLVASGATVKTLTMGGFGATDSVNITVTNSTLAINSSSGTAAASVQRGNNLTLGQSNGNNPTTLTDTGVASLTTLDTFAGALNIGAGYCAITLTPNATGEAQLQFNSCGTRTAGSFVNLTGTFGSAPGVNNFNLLFTTAPSGANFIGGGGAYNSSTASVIPWLRNSGNTLYGYDATRGVTGISGQVANLTSGSTTDVSIGGTAQNMTADQTINSLIGNANITMNSHKLTVTSGAIIADANPLTIGSDSTGTLEFGATEAILTARSVRTLTINSVVDGSAGLTFIGWGSNSGNTAHLALGGANTYSGVTTFYAPNGYYAGLTLNNALALQNSTLNYNNQGGAITFGTPTSYTFGGLSGAQNLAIPASTTLTIGSSGDTDSAYTYSGVLSGTSGALVKAGPQTLTLSGANTYAGGTTINAGSIALSGSGSVGTALLTINGGGTFDVSPLGASATYTLGTGGLKATGGATAATIKPGASGTFAIGASSPLTLVWSGATSGTDSTHPSLTVSQGTLALQTSQAITVNIPGTALGTGVYTLISAANITGGTSFTTTFTGTAIPLGTTGTVSVSGNNVILTVAASGPVVSSPTATPTTANHNQSETISVNVVEGSDGQTISTVTADLSSLGLSSSQAMSLTSGNNTSGTWSYTFNIPPAATPGSYSFPVTATDATSFQGTTLIPLAIATGNYMWNGAGADANWSTGGNWAGSAVPGTGDIVEFATGIASGQPSLDTSFSVAGVTFDSTAPALTITNANSSILTLTGGVTNNSPAAQNLNVPVTLAAASVPVNDATSQGVTLGGVVSGPSGDTLTAAGGTVTLTNVNTYAGPTAISAGTLAIGGAGQLGAGAYAANITDNGTLTYNSSVAQTLSGIISGTGGLNQNGSGALTLSSASSSFTGNIVVNSGTLINTGSAGGGNNATVGGLGNGQTAGRTITVNNGGTLSFQIGNSFGGSGSTPQVSLIINQGGTVVSAVTAGDANALGNITLNGGMLTSGKGSQAKYQALVLGGNVTVGGAAASTINANAGTFNGVMLGANTIFNVADVTGNSTPSLTVSDALTWSQNTTGGSGGFTKTGAGKMTLSGVNTYTGSTTVSGGTLALSGSGSIGNSTNLSIATGATFDVSGLTSTFALGSSQALAGSGGSLAGNVNLNTGSLVLNYTNGTPSLSVTNGTLSFNSNTVTVTVSGGALGAGSYKLVAKNTGGSVSGTLPVNVTVNGVGATAPVALQLVSGELYLVVGATTTALVSPENPSGFKDSVTFTASVKTNGVTAGNVTGTVTFYTNSVAYVTNGLSSGSTNISLSVLPRGTNLITAVYSGDVNYLTSSNSLNEIITNIPPVAGNVTYTRNAGVYSLRITVSDLLTNVTDADGDAITLVATGVSTNGIAVAAVGTNYLDYYNTNNVDDQFSYTVTDGYGGTNSGLVSIVVSNAVTGQLTGQFTAFTNNAASLTFYGIPNYSYVTERSTNLTDWVDIATNLAATNGVINVTDYFSDLGSNAPSSAYYRLKYQP